jgi:cell division protein FtsB
MVQRHQQGLSRGERRLLWRLLVFVLAAAIFWFLFAPGTGVLRYHRLQKQIETLSQENRSLQEHNAALRKEVERLRSDEAYLEEMARQKYGLLRENETVYEFEPSGRKK